MINQLNQEQDEAKAAAENAKHQRRMSSRPEAADVMADLHGEVGPNHGGVSTESKRGFVC